MLIFEEFDDYILCFKQNGYQLLYMVVMVEDGWVLEVQICIYEMYYFVEYGVVVYWCYKESGGFNFLVQKYDEKIVWLCQLLVWKSEVIDVVVDQEEVCCDWVQKFKLVMLDECIYVLILQVCVIELFSGVMLIDFVYYLYSDVGYCCCGVWVDGVMVLLNIMFKNGQIVEIIMVKSGFGVGLLCDWFSVDYMVSLCMCFKICVWFNVIEQQEIFFVGCGLLEKILQCEGKIVVNFEELVQKLGFVKVDDLCLVLVKEEFSLWYVEQVLYQGEEKKFEIDDEVFIMCKSCVLSIVQGVKLGVLVVGIDGFLIQLVCCCKLVLLDVIVGFVMCGKGVFIYWVNCKNFVEMSLYVFEWVIQIIWGVLVCDIVYLVDIFVLVSDCQGLLCDIFDIFLCDKINVIGVSM